MNILVLLDIIKNKNQMPPEQFEHFMNQASEELLALGYETASMGGIDFKLLEENKELKSNVNKLQTDCNRFKTTIIAQNNLISEMFEEMQKMKSQMQLEKETLKTKILTTIRKM